MGLPSLRGLLFWLLLFVSSFLGCVFMLFPFVPFVYFAPSLWRICADYFVGYWLTFPAALCECIFGIKFEITGDLINSSEPALIIMNHRTRLDWLFFWNALYRLDPWLLTTKKISLKNSLKYIPGAGWAMQCAAYLFLQRHHRIDINAMREMITYYKDSKRNYQILLFPEGTDRGKRAIKRSDDFAELHNLPKYQFVLHPRTTGFVSLVQFMREKNYIKNIYDVTVGYPDEIVSTEFEVLIYGRLPNSVHFNVKQYKENDLPKSDRDLAEWINAIWKEKEIRLEKFYKSDSEERKFFAFGKHNIWTKFSADTGYYCALAFWLAISIIWIYFIIFYFTVKIYVLVSCTFFFYCERRYGGVQNWTLKLLKQKQKQ
ncbi:unnamed protein product [Thelazia callipaeda]|uniref:PlsC domain-containing protein n=1 Tax=Thelazia callipaeda TaxID=103827 RepID=A0A0N5CUJ6_THECL|nr:unnamed protein product [Thelazia callipaeda]